MNRVNISIFLMTVCIAFISGSAMSDSSTQPPADPEKAWLEKAQEIAEIVGGAAAV